MRPDGSALEILVSETAQFFIPVQEPAWSPDGQWIAFIASAPADPARCTVYRVRPDGSDRQALAPEGFKACESLLWSQDGQWITVVTSQNLYQIGSDGGELLHYPMTVRPMSRLVPSADGQSVLFLAWCFDIDQGGCLYQFQPDKMVHLYLQGAAIVSPYLGAWDPVLSPPFNLPFHGVPMVGTGLLLVILGISPWSRHFRHPQERNA